MISVLKKIPSSFIALIFIFLLLVFGIFIDFKKEATMNNPTIIINCLQKESVWEGFGASAAWWAQHVGGWEAEIRDPILKLLFDREEGIGLSILRYNIGGGDGLNIEDHWRRAETFEVSQGVYDWSRDANALYVLQTAKEYGVESIVAFVNSPPARMTISGLTTGEKDGKTNLDPEMYSQFAEYLVDVCRFLKEERGLPVQWISPINEPQWNWSYKNGQEGCHYNPQDAAKLIGVVGSAFEKSSLDIKVSPVESAEWKHSELYLEKVMADESLVASLDHFAVHSYWSEVNDKKRFRNYVNQYYPDLKLWMSEWTEMKEGRDLGMDSAMEMVNVIHDDLTIGRVTSWQYWIAVSRYYFRDGLIYVSDATHKTEITKRLWAFGQYSRFVRPGYIRVGVENRDQKLKVTAFLAPDFQKLVLVVINNSDKSIQVPYLISGLDYAQMDIYETSEESDLDQKYSGPILPSLSFSPFSISSIVFQK